MMRVSRFEVGAIRCVMNVSAMYDCAMVSDKDEAPRGGPVFSLQSYNKHHATPNRCKFEGFDIGGGRRRSWASVDLNQHRQPS